MGGVAALSREFLAAVDPGREKCGLALMSTDGGVVERRVAPRREALALLVQWTETYGVRTVVLGDGTGSKEFAREIEKSPLAGRVRVCVVDERLSTLAARERYFEEHPPRGWRRLLPRSLQVPPVPYDDFVAAILGERFLAQRAAESGAPDP